MIKIPDKLKQKGIYFVLIKPREKRPFQNGWQKRTIEYDSYELKEHLYSNGNFGVMGGGPKNLILVDFDNKEVQEQALKILPETFTVQTGSGMLHLYYFTNPNPESFKGFDEEMNTLFDAQGTGKQVVCAGSIHPNGSIYKIYKDKDIAFIDYAELKAKLMQFDRRPKKEFIPVKSERKEYVKLSSDDFLDELTQQVSIAQALEYCGIDTSMNPTGCPFHSSKGGKCLGFNDKTAHCFHCLGSWNVFSLIKEHKKCNFKEALDVIAGLAGMKDELIENKKKYVEAMKKAEAEALQKKIDEEKGKQKAPGKNIIRVPGDDGTVKTFEGKVQDPAATAYFRKMFGKKKTVAEIKEDNEYKKKMLDIKKINVKEIKNE